MDDVCVDHHQTAAIQRVGGDTAQQREADDGADANEADHAERERAPLGRHEQRDVPQNGRLLHHRAREGDQLAGPEQTEVAMLKGGKRDELHCTRLLCLSRPETSPHGIGELVWKRPSRRCISTDASGASRN